ncbi:LRR receptor-like serine/threonine-protein kinase FLS2, partial [Zea mays]|uniref:LRR receptor-like serine/threonine-protein kinase FLS2 n=1 Tax=Zea mays TaxID=4577 RepID=UPI0009AA2C67
TGPSPAWTSRPSRVWTLETLALVQNDGLQGAIPEAIGNLTSLVSLAIQHNRGLTGPIPRRIGQLKRLASLRLQSLGLAGAIPGEIGNLTGLKELYLDDNRLAGSIPPALGKLQKLASLYLSYNSLAGTIPEEIGNMTELRVMDLSDNGLEGELGLGSHCCLAQLRKLSALLVADNQLLGGDITPCLRNKSSLIEANVAGNSFSQISAQAICAGGGSSLQHFLASGNRLWNLRDLDFQNCTSLRYIDLAANGVLAGTQEWLGTLPRHLENIYFARNQLHGTLPPQLGEFGKLTVLGLDENRISGQIPQVLGNLTSLTNLNLGHNVLSGTIPPELGSLYQILQLNLSFNHLSGPLPLTFRNLSKLFSLDLSNCSLTGQAYDLLVTTTTDQVTTAVSFPEIEILALSSNGITGTMPTLLCSASFLKILDLSNNALHGDLPNCLWELPSLLLMDLSSNSFSSVAPSSSSSSSASDTLQSLHLANNRFQGNVPSIIRNCYELITLDLGGNNFTGEIPGWIIAESMPKLRFLRLSSNMLSGSIPQQIFQFTQLQLLDLSHNRLTGPIPTDLANFTGMTQPQERGQIVYFFAYSEQLQLVWKNENYVYSKMITFIMGIDLSCNLLSQTIPQGLTSLRGLRYLNLSRNHLSGDIPGGIGNLALLESLDLSWNQLEGEIPPGFAALEALSTLNLSNNRLSGRIPAGNQLRTLVDPSIYGNNLGLCGFPLEECANAAKHNDGKSQDDDNREVLWLCCFVVAGCIFGFWLSWCVLFCNRPWRYALYHCVDNVLHKVASVIPKF